MLVTTPLSQSWQVVSAESQYVLKMQDIPRHDALPKPLNTADVCASGTCTYTPTTALTSGQTHTWKVQPSNSNEIGLWSSTFRFTVNATAQTLNLTLHSTTKLVTTPLTYSWQTVTSETL